MQKPAIQGFNCLLMRTLGSKHASRANGMTSHAPTAAERFSFNDPISETIPRGKAVLTLSHRFCQLTFFTPLCEMSCGLSRLLWPASKLELAAWSVPLDQVLSLEGSSKDRFYPVFIHEKFSIMSCNLSMEAGCTTFTLPLQTVPSRSRKPVLRKSCACPRRSTRPTSRLES